MPLSLLCACLLFAPAPAQVLPGQWVDGLYSVHLLSERRHPYGKALIDGNDGIRRFTPSVAKSSVFPVPIACFGASRYSYWRGGALYTTAEGCPEKDADGAAFSRLLFAKREDGRWGHLGCCRNYTGDSLEAIPCGGGRFIVVSGGADLAGGGSDRTPFCRMRIPEGGAEAGAEAPIGHGRDGLRGHIRAASVWPGTAKSP